MYEIENNIKIEKNTNYMKKEEFIRLCEEIIDSSTIYDRNLYKNKLKEIYNNNIIYDFPINNKMFLNIMTKLKNSPYKFKD